MAWTETARRDHARRGFAMQATVLMMNGLLSRRFCSL